MADQENNYGVRVTRQAKKRAMEAIGSQFQPANKKRVVLGEISSNAASLENPKVGSDLVQKTKCGSKKVKKAVKAVIAAAKKHELAAEKTDDPLIDPQMCEAYVSDIYEYLHNMEVYKFPLSFSVPIPTSIASFKGYFESRA